MGLFEVITTTDSKLNYLLGFWNKYSQLSPNEQIGYAQLVIISLSGHLESFLCDYLLLELQDISLMLWKGKLRDWMEKIMGKKYKVKYYPIYLLQARVEKHMREKIEKATYSELKDLHKIVTTKSISEVVGHNLARDMEGLSSLRNAFTHSRPIPIEIDTDSFNSIEDFQKHPFEEAVKSLKRDGVVGDSDLRGGKPEDVIRILLGKRTLTFYWNRLKEFLDVYMFSLPERKSKKLSWYQLDSLPKDK